MLIQDIAVRRYCGFFSFYPVIKQIDRDVFRVGGGDSVRCRIYVTYSDCEVKNVICLRCIGFSATAIFIVWVPGIDAEQIAVIGFRLSIKGEFCSTLDFTRQTLIIGSAVRT